MRQGFGSSGGPGPPVGAQLVTAGNRLFTSGLTAASPAGVEPAGRRVFADAVGLLRDAGASPADVVRTRLFYVDADAEPVLRRIHGEVFTHPGPAFSAIRVARLPGGAQLVLELEGVRGAGARTRHHQPERRSSTSAAVALDDEVWLSGMTAAGEDGAVVDAQDPAGQIRLSIRRTEEALRALGVPVADVVATRHFLRPELQGRPRPAEWPAFMQQANPTSAGIAVEGVGPPGAVFMFEADAVRGGSRDRRNLRTGRTYEVEHHYCRAVRVGRGDVVYVAGTTSILPGEIVQHPGEVGPQVHDTLAIIRWAVETQGLAWSTLARARTYVVGGPEKLEEAAEALRAAVGELAVAVTLVGVPVLGRPPVVVEIEATAVEGA